MSTYNSETTPADKPHGMRRARSNPPVSPAAHAAAKLAAAWDYAPPEARLAFIRRVGAGNVFDVLVAST
jgi:hypothetical protein